MVTRLKPGLPTCGLSRHGHPIAYEPLRHHQYGKLLDEIGEEAFLAFYLAQCESRMGQVHRLSQQQQRLVKLVLVIDLRHVSLWSLISRRWNRFDETHLRFINRTLAELLSRIYVINCPGWVTGFYKRIKWWVPANTQRKIRLLGSDYREELLQAMDERVLERMLADVHASAGEGGGAPALDAAELERLGCACAPPGAAALASPTASAAAVGEPTGEAMDDGDGATCVSVAAQDEVMREVFAAPAVDTIDVGTARRSPKKAPPGSPKRLAARAEVVCWPS